MDATKETVVDRLYKRNAKRIENLENQRRLKDEINVANEQLDYFLNIFQEKTDVVEAALNQIDLSDKESIAAQFEHVKERLQDLQNFLAASSFFLKEFNIRKSQGIIQNLQTRCAELETLHLPKKKFGFRSKGVTKKLVDNLKVKPSDVVDSNVKRSNNVTWDLVSCGFSNKTNQKLTLEGESVLKKDISLSHLTDCVVLIKGSPATVHIDNVSNSVILLGPVGTSVFVDKCKNCELVLACQQLRCHSSTDCNVYLHVTSKAIIEDCHGILVAPYNLRYENLDTDYLISCLDTTRNNWDSLDDFNWLTASIPSPNWRVMDKDSRVSDWNSYL